MIKIYQGKVYEEELGVILGEYRNGMDKFEEQHFIDSYKRESFLLKKAREQALADKKLYPMDSHLVVSKLGVMDENGKNVSDYKGNKIYRIKDMPGQFQDMARIIQEGVSDSFKIDMKNINVSNIKIKTASNDPVYFEKPTFIHPVEKDTISNCCSHDKYIWYNVELVLNGKHILNTTWLCLRMYEPTYYSAENGADHVTRFANPDSIVNAFKFIHEKSK